MPITTLPLDQLLSSTSHADLSGRRSLEDVSRTIAKSRRVLVVSGAGISCSSGIPDFRSADGLYSLVKSRYPDAFFTGRDLFSSGLFNNPLTTSIFYTFIAELYRSCQAAQPTRAHHLIQKLEQKGKLLRSYTQNVDGLERRMGLESGGRGNGLKKKGTRNVELHGDLGRVRCVFCQRDYELKAEWLDMFREGEAPDCPACCERTESRVSRCARPLTIGTLRPSIVLYDEEHPLGGEIGGLQAYDLGRNPEVLLIMGTSLKVHGLKRVVKQFAKAVHSRPGGLVVFVNATPPAKEWEGIIDVHVHGETDVWAEKVEQDWKGFKPADWEIQTRLDGEIVVVGGGKEAIKPKAKGPAKPRAPRKPKVKAGPQLPPTPSPSQSPSRSLPEPPSPQSSELTDLSDSLPSSPLAPPANLDHLPTPPMSPSKRRASPSAITSELKPRAPMKKVKSENTASSASSSSFWSNSGQGNLFRARARSISENHVAAFLPTTSTNGIDSSNISITRDECDTFGSPTKSITTMPIGIEKHAPGNGRIPALGLKARSTRAKTRASGKENAAPAPEPSAHPVKAEREGDGLSKGAMSVDRLIGMIC